jgi:UDP-3-O-acyl N-acetylglucosamine deacetylase
MMTTTVPFTQRTIERPVVVRGFGYLSGEDVEVEFRPAAAGSGVRFVRSDLPSRPVVPAKLACREDAQRRTVLASGGVRVEMVEHVMAALAGLGVDNCEIWLSASELPCGDGSALPFVEALDASGVVDLGVPARSLPVAGRVRVGDEDAWLEARPTITGGLSVEYHLDYGPRSPIGRQSIAVELNEEVFRTELAPCRTFLLRCEADALLATGVGGRVTPDNLLVIDQEGPLRNALRFEDECARHKAVDLLGDLALVGQRIVAHVVAYRSGHRLNAALGKALLRDGTSLAPGARYRVA